MLYLWAYFVFINLLSFGAFGVDKYKAIKQKRRISELDLLVVTALGGFIGSIGGMTLFKHKTIKSTFLIRFRAIIAFWLVASFIYLIYG